MRESDDDATKRGIRRENESAQVLARCGYDIEQAPDFPGPKNPDFRIEGKIFDNYSPDEGTSLRNIHSEIKRKITKKQTRRVIINLNDSRWSPGQLAEQFKAWRIPDLEEVIAIKDGRIYQIFPETD